MWLINVNIYMYMADLRGWILRARKAIVNGVLIKLNFEPNRFRWRGGIAQTSQSLLILRYTEAVLLYGADANI